MNKQHRNLITILIIILCNLWVSGCTPQSSTTEPALTAVPVVEKPAPKSTVTPFGTEIRPEPSATTVPSTQLPTQTQTPVPPTSTDTPPAATPTFVAIDIQRGNEVAFASSGQWLDNLPSSDVELGDLDGDGDLDVFVANNISSQVWFNDGNAIFSESGQRLGAISGLKLGDLDQDGDLDAFTVDHQRGIAIWLNDGVGNFARGQGATSMTGYDVAIGDVDGDGDIDAYIAREELNSLWLNNGQGDFANSGQQFGSYNPVDDVSIKAILADLDGDDDLDVFEVIYNGRHRVWFNDGAGLFTNSGQAIDVDLDNSHGVALGDLDHDGDLDAFVTVTNRMAFQVWFNDGKGIFTNSGQSLPSSNAQSVALGDLDGDGDLDAFMVNTGNSDAGEGNTIWLNDGNGNFHDSHLRLGHQYSLALALGDLDGDGDLDAFVANSNFSNPVDKSNKVWLNMGLDSE